MATALASCRPAPSAQGERGLGRLGALALLPRETEIVLAVDLARLRGQPVWKTVSSSLAKNAKPFLDAVAASTGIDVAGPVQRIWVGLPGERQEDGRFVLIAETDPGSPARAAPRPEKAPAGATVAVLGPRQIVISKGAWARKAAPARKDAGSAADNPELRRLCERAVGDHSVWFAALVPPELRRSLMGQSQLEDAAALSRVFGFLDDSNGLHLELVGELADTTAPPMLAHRLQMLLNQAKRDPDLLIAGLSPHLEALHVTAHGASVRASLELPDSQANDVALGIEALALTARTKYSRAP